MNETSTLMMLGATATGVSIGGFLWAILSVIAQDRHDRGHDAFEFDRRKTLRKGDTTYRLFEPLVDSLVALQIPGSPESLATLNRKLPLTRDPLPWTAAEFVATSQLQAILAGLAGVSFGVLLDDVFIAAVGGLFAFVGYQEIAKKSKSDQATAYVVSIKSRLPFAIELMALMMQSGSSFMEALTTTVNENREHPLGAEFSRVLDEVAAGRPRSDALRTLQARLCDQDVTEFVFGVTKGEELGTPLSEILRNQAEQMRLRRSQWIEKATAEAQVQLVFPGTISMVACMVICVAPFVLQAMDNAGF